MTNSSFRLLVSGRVQGVGFRAWTKRVADQMALRGSVWNRDDGMVEVLVAGEPRAVEEFRKRLHSGPPLARVDSVSILEEGPEVSGATFEVTRE